MNNRNIDGRAVFRKYVLGVSGIKIVKYGTATGKQAMVNRRSGFDHNRDHQSLALSAVLRNCRST